MQKVNKRFTKKTFLLALAAVVLAGVVLVLGVHVWQQNAWEQKRAALESCEKELQGDPERCVGSWIDVWLHERGMSAALDELARRYDRDPSFGLTCHSLTHTLGKAAHELFVRGKKFDVTAKTAYCSYGFYHGFMEQLAARGGDMKLAREFCAYVDSKIAKDAPDANLQCYHGIGHGTVNNHNPQTWGNEEAMIAPALDLCHKAATTELELSRCATGVFNGIATFYQNGEYNLRARVDDPLWICRLYEPLFEDACYMSLNITLLDVAGNNIVKAAGFVEAIENDRFAQHAMINLAAPLGAKRVEAADHSDILAACRRLQQRLRIACIQGYAYGFLEHGKPGVEYEKPIAFCGSEYLTGEEQNGCFEYIFSYFRQWYSQSKAQAICGSLPQMQLQQMCRRLSSTQENP